MPKFIKLNLWKNSGFQEERLVNIDLVRSIESTFIGGKKASLLHYTFDYNDGVPVHHTPEQIMEMINA